MLLSFLLMLAFSKIPIMTGEGSVSRCQQGLQNGSSHLPFETIGCPPGVPLHRWWSQASLTVWQGVENWWHLGFQIKFMKFLHLFLDFQSCSNRVSCFCLRTGNRTCFLQLFELAHMFDATQHLGLGWGVITFLNLNTRRCYATSGLAHMFDATQHLGLHTCSMLRNIWACTHARCYATSGLAHMFDATQHLGLHTCWMLRNCWCSLGLHTCWMLRNLEKERHPFDCDDFIVVLGHMIAVWDATSYTKMMNTWIENMIANNMLTLE